MANKDFEIGKKHALAGKPSQPPSSVKYIENYMDGYNTGKKEKSGVQNAYQNGRAKAEQYINSRMEELGLKVENLNGIYGFRPTITIKELEDVVKRGGSVDPPTGWKPGMMVIRTAPTGRRDNYIIKEG